MNSKTRDLIFMSLFLAIIIICSKITFNVGIIPITLQTFSVIITSYFLKVKKSILVFALYIIMGLIGIPVFSNGGGYYYILKPSFGFILGFLIQCLITGNTSNNEKSYLTLLKGFLGLAVIDIIGLIYMAFILNIYYDYNKSLYQILKIGFTPFIIKDCISVIIAFIVYKNLNNILKDRNC